MRHGHERRATRARRCRARAIGFGNGAPCHDGVPAGGAAWLRPAGGLVPGKEEVLIGKALKRKVSFGEQLSVADVEVI